MPHGNPSLLGTLGRIYISWKYHWIWPVPYIVCFFSNFSDKICIELYYMMCLYLNIISKLVQMCYLQRLRNTLFRSNISRESAFPTLITRAFPLPNGDQTPNFVVRFSRQDRTGQDRTGQDRTGHDTTRHDMTKHEMT